MLPPTATMYAPAIPTGAYATETMAAVSATPRHPMAGAAAAMEMAKANNSAHLAGLVKCLCDGLRVNVFPQGLDKLCSLLANGIDAAIVMNNIPLAAACRLPEVVKQLIHLHGKNVSIQVVLTLLMICIKNACMRGWFKIADAEELINMTNELCSKFIMEKSSAQAEQTFALNVISKVIVRFYPQFKLVHLIASLQAKPGYQTLLLDFNISSSISRGHRVGLFVMQTDNLQTSSCIANPSQVNFLVNGKGVERQNASLDNGPQFPLGIRNMLKPGINFLQAVGYFGGNYLISVATYGKASLNPILEEYVELETSSVDSGDEIIVGPSRISLNCPISFTRIKSPVKGHLCKHYQCFDYNNYIEMNSRKPSWRCPYCSQPVSYVDLRIDREMVKILDKAGENSAYVIFASDGSWNLATTEASGGTDSEYEADNPSCDAPNIRDNIVDLTMGSDDETEAVYGSKNEVNDRKPLSSEYFHSMENPSESSAGTCTRVTIPPVPAEVRDGTAPTERPAMFASPGLSMTTALHDSSLLGTLESLISGSVPTPTITDVTPSFNCPAPTNYGVTQPTLPFLENTLFGQQTMQTQHSQLNNSAMNDGTRRSYLPSGIQLASQAFSSLLMPQLNMLMSSTSGNNSASSLYTSSTLGCVPDGSIAPGNLSSTARTQANLLIPSILRNNSASSSYHSSTIGYVANGSSAPGNNYVVPQVSRTPNVMHQSSQLQPMTQSKEHQRLWNHQILRSQHMVGATTSNLHQSSGNPLDQPREVGTNVVSSNLTRHHNIMVSGSLPNIHDNCYRPQSPHAVQMPNQQMSTVVSSRVRSNGLRRTHNDRVSNDILISSEQRWRPTGTWRSLLMGGGASVASTHFLSQHSDPSVSTLPPTYDHNLHVHTLMGIPDA